VQLLYICGNDFSAIFLKYNFILSKVLSANLVANFKSMSTFCKCLYRGKPKPKPFDNINNQIINSPSKIDFCQRCAFLLVLLSFHSEISPKDYNKLKKFLKIMHCKVTFNPSRFTQLQTFCIIYTFYNVFE